MNHKHSSRSSRRQPASGRYAYATKAFTLVEVLVVVSIIGLLVAVAFTSVNSALASQRLSIAARQLSADLQNASMIARKENRPVEVRFYQLPPLDGPGVNAWRGYQIAVLNAWDASGKASLTFKTEMQRLPNDVVLMPDATYNTIAGLTQKDNTSQSQGANTGAPAASRYVSYFIHSNGHTTLPAGEPAVLTLVRETPNGIPATLPADFRSIVIDPKTHQSRVY